MACAWHSTAIPARARTHTPSSRRPLPRLHVDGHDAQQVAHKLLADGVGALKGGAGEGEGRASGEMLHTHTGAWRVTSHPHMQAHACRSPCAACRQAQEHVLRSNLPAVHACRHAQSWQAGVCPHPMSSMLPAMHACVHAQSYMRRHACGPTSMSNMDLTKLMPCLLLISCVTWEAALEPSRSAL